jgi:hypothetical protein
MDEYEFIFDHNVLIRKFINNNKIMDTTWNIISEDCVELRYKEKEDMFIPQTDLSVGVLTVLYKGPWMVWRSGGAAGEHFSL